LFISLYVFMLFIFRRENGRVERSPRNGGAPEAGPDMKRTSARTIC
jgi:hypothetical protein